MAVIVTVTFRCGGCEATATAPEQIVRSEFRSLSGQSHGFGCQVQEAVKVASVAPEGWITFDPWTGCTYCPACWASIVAEVEAHEPVSRTATPPAARED